MKKQMMKKVTQFVAGAALLPASLSFAGGTDVGAGGQTVDVSGRPALRDLVDNTVCDWVGATEFMQRLPRVSPALDALKKTHWFLALSYELESRQLSVCQVASGLKSVPTEDQAGLTIGTNLQAKQVAVRLNNAIYIDMQLFNRMDAENQAYLFLHEVGHSFIPLDTERRNSKIRSFVMAIRSNEKNLKTPEAFATQLEMNSVKIVNKASLLDPVKEVILFAAKGDLTDEQIAVARERIRRGSHLLTVDDYRRLFPLKDTGVTASVVPQLKDWVISSILAGDEASISRLLDAGLDPSYKLSFQFYYRGSKKFVEDGKFSAPLLHHLLENGLLKNARYLLALPTDTQIAGDGALEEAVKIGDLELVEEIVKKCEFDENADPRISLSDAWHAAVNSGNPQMVAAVLKVSKLKTSKIGDYFRDSIENPKSDSRLLSLMMTRRDLDLTGALKRALDHNNTPAALALLSDSRVQSQVLEVGDYSYAWMQFQEGFVFKNTVKYSAKFTALADQMRGDNAEVVAAMFKALGAQSPSNVIVAWYTEGERKGQGITALELAQNRNAAKVLKLLQSSNK